MNEVEDCVWEFNVRIALEGLKNGVVDKLSTHQKKRAKMG